MPIFFDFSRKNFEQNDWKVYGEIKEVSIFNLNIESYKGKMEKPSGKRIPLQSRSMRIVIVDLLDPRNKYFLQQSLAACK